MNPVDTFLVVFLALGTVLLNKEYIQEEFFSGKSKSDDGNGT
jgi:hypothetical protein